MNDRRRTRRHAGLSRVAAESHAKGASHSISRGYQPIGEAEEIGLTDRASAVRWHTGLGWRLPADSTSPPDTPTAECTGHWQVA